MKLLMLCCFLVLGVGAFAEERVKRQATYTFPGPRGERSHRQHNPAYVPEDQDEEIARRQYNPQPQPQYQPQYQPQPPPRAPAPQAPPPTYEAPQAPRTQGRSVSSNQNRRRQSAATTSRANKYNSAPAQSLGPDEEEEEEHGPDPLTLLLEDSQFTCGGKTDGYYADDSVNCQVFHYCVGGAKHSWMCPENTVFHQVHLNCVPDAQDICSQSQKFHFVNDYLYKPVDYEGPNKTARYSQRYYPDGYVVGDPLVAPQDQGPRRPAAPAPQPQTYAAPAPQPQSYPASRSRQPSRQVAPQAPPPPSYNRPPPQEERVYRPEPEQPTPRPRPVERRPSRPVETYPQAESPTYRAIAQPQPSYRSAQPPPPQQTYRVVPPQEASPQPTYRVVPPQQSQPPPQQVYRVVPPQEAQTYRGPPQPTGPSPHRPSHSSSEESQYETPRQSIRRPVAPPPQRQGGYAPPRQQYRAQSRSYQPYAAPQVAAAAGVEYDEDY